MSYDEHLISMAGGDGEPDALDLDAIQAPLPADARMDAYYYGFERTGVGCIDAILSAVAIAGKGSHHTQSWGEDSEFGYYKNRPGLPDAANAVELIQEAATQASGSVTALLALVREQQAQIGRVQAEADSFDELASDASYFGTEATMEAWLSAATRIRAIVGPKP